ncbi:unnamed protein product, partial [Heterosigma akashiwo]
RRAPGAAPKRRRATQCSRCPGGSGAATRLLGDERVREGAARGRRRRQLRRHTAAGSMQQPGGGCRGHRGLGARPGHRGVSSGKFAEMVLNSGPSCVPLILHGWIQVL